MAIDVLSGEIKRGESLGPLVRARKLKNVIAAEIDGRLVDLHTPIDEVPQSVKLITTDDPQALFVLRHSTAHVLADAVKALFPQAKVTIGPATESGFYYDFDYEPGFTPADLERIEAKMREIVSRGDVFSRRYLTRAQMLELFQRESETYKLDIISAIPDGEPLSVYAHGGFTDLCRGPHLPDTGFIRAFKLTHTAGAYWRGDEKNKMLHRIYGTAFFSQAELESHLKQQEEAKKRDHRKLGKDLDLFHFHPWAPASPFFTPRGTIVYQQLIDWMRGLYRRVGYQEVVTPQVFDLELFKRSGHYDNYRENMFYALPGDAAAREAESGREFAQKPMNCPGHCLLYDMQRHSYRDLPLRYADFGRLHRYERSGVTAGLVRVRTFCIDDVHIYCALEQMHSEILDVIDLTVAIYRALGIGDWSMALATRPEKSLGSEEMWRTAEGALTTALVKRGIKYSLLPGEGAFYGPKIEFHIKDAIGRSWQLGTLQVDFAMPERFGLTYIGADNQEHRPVMLHRAVFGSLERFIGVYLEHTGGNLPAWLAPEQVRIVTISDEQREYGEQILEKLANLAIRAHLVLTNEKLGAKIRDAQLMKIPFTLVVGKKEVEQKSVSIRRFGQEDLGSMPLDAGLQLVSEQSRMPVVKIGQ